MLDPRIVNPNNVFFPNTALKLCYTDGKCRKCEEEHSITSIFDAYIPVNQVFGQGLQVELPQLVIGHRTQIHGILPRGEGALDDSTRTDEVLTGQGIDLHRVPKVRVQQPVYRMDRAELSVRGYYIRFCAAVSPQPGKNALLGQLIWFQRDPHLR